MNRNSSEVSKTSPCRPASKRTRVRSETEPQPDAAPTLDIDCAGIPK